MDGNEMTGSSGQRRRRNECIAGLRRNDGPDLCEVLTFVILSLVLSFSGVDAGASDKITQLKARVLATPAPAAVLPAAAARPLPASKAATPAAAAPCTKAPTEALPVHLHGITDQMPGDKEANEKLIAKIDPDLALHKKLIIAERNLKSAEAMVDQATNTQDNFHQFQAVVLRDTVLPKPSDDQEY
jgi:hypothetical protein